MPENQLSKLANETGKALTVQAGLAGVLGVILSHCYPFTTTEISAIAGFLSLSLVWIGRRIINRADADEAMQEPTRAMALLRDKTEQEILAMDANDPRRPQRIRQAADLTEMIFRKTVETDFVPVLNQSPPPPLELPSSNEGGTEGDDTQ
jgi:hypothetical protein